MKKILAILLVLAMVLPMCVFANAAGEDVGVRPFMITNYEELDVEFDNFYPMIFFWSRATSDYISEDDVKVSVPGVGGGNPKAVAENLKKVFDKFPDGIRYIRVAANRAAMVYHVEDVIFMEKGVKIMKNWFDEFIEHYHSIGGKIDGIVTDIEYLEGSCYNLTSAAQKDLYIYNKIVEHPMYAEKIRPQLVERGFKFWPNVSEETPEIYSINSSSGAEYTQSRSIWDVVYRNHLNQYVTDTFLDSLLKYYPDGIVCDYQSRTTYAWHKNMSDKGGIGTGGNYYTAGNANYFNTYAARPGTGFFKDDGAAVYKNIPSYNKAVFEDNPYNMILWDSIFAKNLKASAPDGNFTATVTFYNYTGRETSYCNSPYYSEMMYHIGLLDPKPFKAYCMDNEIKGRGSDVEYSIQIMSELMDELTRIVGAADRKPLELTYTWNDKFILSGMYAGGKNYYRLTPDITGGKKVEDFQVKDAKDLTFTAEGQTVTFPGGKIIEDAKITEVGTCGYWIETEKDVLPVVSYAENRHEQYPAYVESYESYKPGEYNAVNAQPNGCWEVKKTKNATAKIVAADGNNVLALTGDYSLKVKDILKNITAGDTYAENQAWEVEVTLPANMAAEAEIIALNIFGTKSKAEEGGFKIAGGKVYYDNAGSYVELTGVDVSKGGKFKLKRTVDFNNADAFTSNYAIYNASGELLGQVKNVPMVQVKLPVQKLNLSVAGITGDAVLLDNFKLYANGVGDDFELYNAKTGIEYTDLETAKDSNTAYRLSWMNATAYEKIYSIVAAYYNGDKLVEEKVVKEIKMAPGADAVATGVVEVKDGQSVKVYVRNDSQPEPEDTGKPGTNKPGANAAKNDDTVLLIVVIAVAVVLVAGIVVAVVLLTKKKPAKKATKKPVKKVAKKASDQTAE